MGGAFIDLNINAQSPPVAVALANQTSVLELSNVTLYGSSSFSPENISITNYNWTEIDANSPVHLIASGSNATFKAPDLAGQNPVNYTFSLIVTDANGLVSTPSIINITVNSMNQTSAPSIPPESPPVFIEPAPHATVTFPANYSTNIPVKPENLMVTFDKDIDRKSARIHVADNSSNVVPVKVSIKGAIVSIIPKIDLSPDTNYTVYADNIRGVGQTSNASIKFSFVTASLPTSPPASENHPPQALNQEVTTESDKPVQIPLGAGAIDNDTEDSLSAEIVTPPEPSHGSLGSIDQNTGNVTYTPAPGFSGNDSFTFKVMDNHQAESNIATVSITVKPVPTPVPTSPPPPPSQHQYQLVLLHQKIIHHKL